MANPYCSNIFLFWVENLASMLSGSQLREAGVNRLLGSGGALARNPVLQHEVGICEDKSEVEFVDEYGDGYETEQKFEDNEYETEQKYENKYEFEVADVGEQGVRAAFDNGQGERSLSWCCPCYL